jgi:WD40 repeat protein
LLDAPFHAAKRHMTAALTYLSHFHHEAANVEFREVLNNAILAFQQSTSYDKKVLATKLRIVSTLHLNSFFDCKRPEFMNCSLVHDLINEIWNDFLSLAEIRTSLRDEFEGRRLSLSKLLGSKVTRRCVLYSIANIKSIVSEILRDEPKVKAPLHDVELNMYDVKPVVVKGHHEAVVSSLIVGSVVFTGSCDHTIKAWDISPHTYGELLGTLIGHTADVRSLATYQGRYLFSASGDQSIKVWDISSATASPPVVASKLIGTLPPGHSQSVNALAVHKNYLFSGSHDYTIKCWHITQIHPAEEITCVETLSSHIGTIFSLVVHDGKLFSGSGDRNVYVWDIDTLPLSPTPLYALHGSQWCIYTLVIMGHYLFAGNHGHVIVVWDLSTFDKTLSSIACLRGHTSYVLGLAATPTRLFSCAGDNTIQVWDIATKPFPTSPIGSLEGHSNIIKTLSISSGRLISGASDRTIHLRCI